MIHPTRWMMRKKVKSFTIEEGPYEQLFKLFKENYVDVSISYCLNKYIKDFLAYLQAIEAHLKASDKFSIPMSFVIETAAREPVFRVVTERVAGEGVDSIVEAEAWDLQKRYDAHIGRNPESLEKEKIEALDGLEAAAKFTKALIKLAAKSVKDHREPTDDEIVEVFRGAGGKGLEKAIREKWAPFMDRFDPDLGDLVKKAAKNKRTDGGER
jgi:hypothetical protein